MRSILAVFDGPNGNRALLAFVYALAVILAALGSQFIGGIVPCEMCYWQRWPYYIGLPILGLVLLFWEALPARIRLALTALVMAIFVVGMFLGIYHAGVEYGFWPGPATCTTPSGGLDFSQLNSLNDASVVMCDVVQFEIFGISLAGMNAMASAFTALVLGWSVLGQWQRIKREG